MALGLSRGLWAESLERGDLEALLRRSGQEPGQGSLGPSGGAGLALADHTPSPHAGGELGSRNKGFSLGPVAGSLLRKAPAPPLPAPAGSPHYCCTLEANVFISPSSWPTLLLLLQKDRQALELPKALLS